MTTTADLEPNEFPIGAALTVAYGSNERPFCNLADLYRILGAFTGQIPAPHAINDTIAECRDKVLKQLPDELRAIDPPPADAGNEAADVAWVAGIKSRYGPTIRLDADLTR